MRDTIGRLEADFTQSQIISAGDLQHLKDKIVKQDHLIKLQKQSFDDLSTDLSSQIKSFQETVSQQSHVIKALQTQIAKTNQALQESQRNHTAEINSLKEQVTALKQNSKDDIHTTNPAVLQQPEPSTSFEDNMPNIYPDNSPTNRKPQLAETSTLSEVITSNIPTANRFLPLQNCNESDISHNREINNQQETGLETNKARDVSRRQQETGLETNTGNSSKTKPRDTPPIPAVVNKAVFLCDSNGKFLDKRKLFPSGQEFTFFRCPKIEHASTILQDEINQQSEHPQLIVIHSGTNDLTTTTPIDDFISDVSVLITQASTKFPKSKVIYSTLLPRADISLHTLSKINTKLIDSCSTLPNVHLVSHENIFSKGLDVLHDNKHLKKRHLGLFAANLVAAIRGRAKPRRSDPNQLFRSPPPSGSRSLHTTPLEDHASHVRAYSSQEKQLQPPSSRSPYASYSHVVKHGHNNSYHTYPPPTMAERMDSSASPPNDPELSKYSGAEIPKELVSFLRFIKTLL